MSYRLWHQHKRQVIVSPPGSQHSSVVLDGGSNKSVRASDFPWIWFLGWLALFLICGIAFFHPVVSFVADKLGSMGGAL